MSLQSPPRPTHSQVLGSQQQEDQQHHHQHESKREKQNQEQQNPQHHQQEQQQQLQKIDEEQEHQQEKQYLCQNQQQKPNRPECQQKQPDCPYQEQQQHQEQNQQEQNAHQDQQQQQQQQQQHPQECKPEQPNSCQYQHEQHALKKQKKEQQEVNLNLRQPKQEQSLCNGKQGEHEHPHQDQQEQHHNPCQQQLASQHQHQIHDHQHPQHPHQFLQYPHHDQHIPQHFHQHQQHPHLHQQQPQHDHHTPQQHHAHRQHPYPYQQHHTNKGLVFMYPEVRGAIAPTVHYLASPPAQLGGTIGSSLGNVQLSQNQQYVQGSVIHESPIPQHIYPAPLASHGEVVGDKDLFLTTLSKFHAALGTKLSIPRIGGKDLDLHLLYKEVTTRGGLETVIKDRKWKEITLVFNFPPTTTSASFVLRKYYFYLLHQYEQVYYFQRKGPVVPSPVPLSSVSPASHSLSETECTRSPLEDPVVAKKKQKIDSAQALGVDPASSIGTAVTGCIDGKFDHGYLVNVTVGTRKMRGVLYHVPPSSTVPQHATVSPFMNSLGNELKATVMDHQIQRRRKKKLMSRKDPGAPRQNRTGYNFFFAEQRARLKSTQPDKDRAISKMIGDLWNSLSEEEKLPYQERGIQEKERYKKEMCEYKERKRLQAQGVVVGTSSSLSSLQTETKCDHMSDIDLNVVKSVEFKQELIPYQEQIVQPLSESSSVTSSSNHQTLVPGNSDVNAIKNLSSDDGSPVTIDLQDMGKKLFKPDVSNQQKPV